MTENMNKINSIKSVQKSIDDMLVRGAIGLKGIHSTNQWLLEPLHQGKSCSVGFVHIADTEAGPCQEHVHLESREYLIVISGSVMLNVNGDDVRVLKPGDCGVVQPGEAHFSRPLENNTKLVYVCVPSDAGMNSLIESLEKKVCQKK
jgi:quercetin dioxygenase-like cupin family protein